MISRIIAVGYRVWLAFAVGVAGIGALVYWFVFWPARRAQSIAEVENQQAQEDAQDAQATIDQAIETERLLRHREQDNLDSDLDRRDLASVLLNSAGRDATGKAKPD